MGDLFKDISPTSEQDMEPHMTLIPGKSHPGWAALPLDAPFAPVYASDWHGAKTSDGIPAVQWLTEDGSIHCESWKQVALSARRAGKYVLDQMGITEDQAWNQRRNGFKGEETPIVVAIVAHADSWQYRLVGECRFLSFQFEMIS